MKWLKCIHTIQNKITYFLLDLHKNILIYSQTLKKKKKKEEDQIPIQLEIFFFIRIDEYAKILMILMRQFLFIFFKVNLCFNLGFKNNNTKSLTSTSLRKINGERRIDKR